LSYTHDGSETSADSFVFAVRDANGAATASDTFTLVVAPVNDAPLAESRTITLDGTQSYMLQPSDFGYSDAEADSLATVRITALPSTGTLVLDDAPVVPGQDVAAADIGAGKLRFVFNSAPDAVVSDGFAFQVSDGTSFSASSYVLTIHSIPALAGEEPGGVAPPANDSGTALTPNGGGTAISTAVPASTATTVPPPADKTGTAATEPSAAEADSFQILAADVNGGGGSSGAQALATDTTSAEPSQARSAAARHVTFELKTVSFEPARFGLSIASLSPLPVSDTASIGSTAQSEPFLRELDRLRETIRGETEFEHRLIGSAVAVGTGLSVGYVIWLLRGGLLITSLLSSLPAWRYVDPLPVLGRLRGDDDEDDESLESIVESSREPEETDAQRR
ncbi:MAG TPA: cadherin-like domain-containing protein, partial [Burkholderiales bacterium]|nr:cadherin-like domain-containing protein [Burkholderiales bacterium]